MSKYTALWEYIRKRGEESFSLRFEQIGEIAGVLLDHSFLKYKKELTVCGYQVEKISMKAQPLSDNLERVKEALKSRAPVLLFSGLLTAGDFV